jgi:type I restriction enzyme S subunit
MNSDNDSGWRELSLGEAAKITMGQSPPSSTYNTEGFGLPFHQGKAEFGFRYPVVEKWCSEPQRIAEAGSILVSVRAPVGDVNIADTRCCIGRGLAAVSGLADTSVTDYLYFYLQYHKAAIESKGTGSTFKAINKGTLHDFFVLLPPLPEQRRIAAVLNAIQDAIAAQEDVIAAARQFKRSLMQRLFTYGPGREPAETKETEIGEIPAHWEVVELGELIGEGPQNGLYKPLSDYGDGTPILRINDYDNEGYISSLAFREVRVEEAEKQRYLLSEDDIVINRVNSLSHLGKSALIVTGSIPSGFAYAVKLRSSE